MYSNRNRPTGKNSIDLFNLKSHPCKSLKKCVLLDVLSLPGHRAACVKSIQIRDAYTTRVLLGNTAYCNIYWVSNYKQERKNK